MKSDKPTDLHSTAETENQVEGRLLLNIIVGEGTTILKLLASEDKALLVRRDTLLILDLRLHIVDGIARLHLKGDGLPGHFEVVRLILGWLVPK